MKLHLLFANSTVLENTCVNFPISSHQRKRRVGESGRKIRPPPASDCPCLMLSFWSKLRVWLETYYSLLGLCLGVHLLLLFRSTERPLTPKAALYGHCSTGPQLSYKRNKKNSICCGDYHMIIYVLPIRMFHGKFLI